MSTLTGYRAIIDMWPTKAAMQVELGKMDGKTAPVREWYARKRIPPRWFRRVVEAAQACGFEGVTYEVLTNIHKASAASRVVLAEASTIEDII